MKYMVHRLEVGKTDLQEKLENFLNRLEGEIISVVPHVITNFMIYGAKTDYILIIEKIK